MITLKYLLVLLAFGFICDCSFAQDIDHPREDHHTYKHHIALLGGSTANLTHHSNLLMVGLDYEYRLPFVHHKFGVGLNIEHLEGDVTENIFGVSFLYHPYMGLKFLTSPMIALIEEHPDPAHGSGDVPADPMHSEFAFRIGTGYDFHINHVCISPVVNFDFVGDTKAIAYGIDFGYEF